MIMKIRGDKGRDLMENVQGRSGNA